MIPRYALTPPRWALLQPELTSLTDEIRLNVALRYGINKVLSIPNGRHAARQVAEEIVDKRMRSVALKIIVEDMLTEDLPEDACTLAETIEDEDMRDDVYQECVDEFIISGDMGAAVKTALKITSTPKRQFALLHCGSGFYAQGQFDVGTSFGQRHLGSMNDLPIPAYLRDFQPCRLVGMSFQPMNVVFIRPRTIEGIFENIKVFNRTAQSSPEKDLFLAFIASGICGTNKETVKKSVLIASMIEDLKERDRTFFRMSSNLSTTPADNPSMLALVLLVPDLAKHIECPELQSACLVECVEKLLFHGKIPEAFAIAQQIPNLELRYSTLVRCKEKRTRSDYRLSTFFHLNVAPKTIMKLDAHACHQLLPQEARYKPLATCMEVLAKDEAYNFVRKMAFTVNLQAQECFPTDYIDEDQKAKTHALREALANDDDIRALQLLEEEVKAPVPLNKLSGLFAMSLELGMQRAALMLLKRGAQIPPDRKNELLKWAKELDMITPLLLLIEDGAQIAMTQEELEEFMRCAISRRRNKASAILLPQIKNIHAQEEDSGNTFLHIACKGRLLETVELLIANGASPHCPNTNGRTPTDIAKKYAHYMLKALLEGQSLESVYAALELSE